MLDVIRERISIDTYREKEAEVQDELVVEEVVVDLEVDGEIEEVGEEVELMVREDLWRREDQGTLKKSWTKTCQSSLSQLFRH